MASGTNKLQSSAAASRCAASVTFPLSLLHLALPGIGAHFILFLLLSCLFDFTLHFSSTCRTAAIFNMVFLRLEVKVFPREQAPSSPGLLRSLIGNNGDRARDEAIAPKKFASFLLAVDKPEDTTLGDLACMILDEWHLLRPDQE